MRPSGIYFYLTTAIRTDQLVTISTSRYQVKFLQQSYIEWHVWLAAADRKWRLVRVQIDDCIGNGTDTGRPYKSQEPALWDPQYLWKPPTQTDLPCNLSELQNLWKDDEDTMTADIVNVRLVKQPGDANHGCLVSNDYKPYEPSNSESQSLYRSAEYLLDVRSLGCRIILEEEVITTDIISGFTAKVWVEQRFRIEKKLPLAPFHLNPFLYEMKALYQLRGCNGITPFIGVKVDREEKRLQGYIRGYETQTMGTVLSGVDLDDKGVSWRRRSRWARQLTQGLFEAHSRSLVIGTLDVNTIGIDEDDNAVFLHITHGICPLAVGCLAPELRKVQMQGRLRDHHITSRQDIFAMGLVLWLLCQTSLPEGVRFDASTRGRKPWWKKFFCVRSGCVQQHVDFEESTCVADHVDPVDLPPCADEIPHYYRSLISRCRATQPSFRPTALELKEALLRKSPNTRRGRGSYDPRRKVP